jgi:hypothetical protein
VGDFYVDMTDHTIYGPKNKKGWGTPISLVLASGAPGIKGATGGTGAAGGPGAQGPAGVAGASGATGAEGPQGPMGYAVLHGTSAPSASTGEDNDFYIDTSTTQLYGPREDGVWGSPVSMTGAANISVIDGGSL